MIQHKSKVGGLVVIKWIFIFSLSHSFLSSGHLMASGKFMLGVDYLERTNFSVLAGKKVGLLTHPAGKNASRIATVRVLHKSPKVNLVALFGQNRPTRFFAFLPEFLF